MLNPPASHTLAPELVQVQLEVLAFAIVGAQLNTDSAEMILARLAEPGECSLLQQHAGKLLDRHEMLAVTAVDVRSKHEAARAILALQRLLYRILRRFPDRWPSMRPVQTWSGAFFDDDLAANPMQCGDWCILPSALYSPPHETIAL